MQTSNLDIFITTLACLCSSPDFGRKTNVIGFKNSATFGNVSCAPQDLNTINLKLEALESDSAKQTKVIEQLRNEIKSLKREINSGKSFATSCEEQENNVINIKLKDWDDPLEVRCYDGFQGNWTLVAKRKARGISFNRTWAEFKTGFGTHDDEFFIGLQNLHDITTSQPHELLVLFFFKDVTAYGRYRAFEIGSESTKYAITKWGAYAGTIGNAYHIPVGGKFSTYDDMNDSCPPTVNCVYLDEPWFYSVGRWFCCYLGLLSFYRNSNLGYQQEIKWYIRPTHY